jgi:hypothetical protein
MTDQTFPFVNPRGWRDRAARAAARKLYDTTRVDARGQRAAQVERQRLTAVLVDAENEVPRHIAIVQSRYTSYEAKLIAQRRLEELGDKATEAAERLAQLDGPPADATDTWDPLAEANAQLEATGPQPEPRRPQTEPPQAQPSQTEPPLTPTPVEASVQQAAAEITSTGEAQSTADAGQSAEASTADMAAAQASTVTQDAAATQATATETKPKTKNKTK